MLPSERARAWSNARRRQRPRTVRVWRCRACRATFDSDPSFSCAATCGGCPRCNAIGSIYETRVKD